MHLSETVSVHTEGLFTLTLYTKGYALESLVHSPIGLLLYLLIYLRVKPLIIETKHLSQNI